MNKEAFLNKIAETIINGETKTKNLFRIKTVPTVETYSNIGFNGLQELCDVYRAAAKVYDAEGDTKMAAESREAANECEKFYDKWNGMSTTKVDVGDIIDDGGKLLAGLFPGYVFMAAKSGDDDGMYIDFQLGPLLKDVVDKTFESEDDPQDCDCPACTAERERHASGIPKDQLN